MPDVVGAIREQIQYHKRELARLERMLEAGGASTEVTIKGLVLEQLADSPKTSGELIAATGCKPNSLYVQVARMKKAGEIVETEGRYKLP